MMPETKLVKTASRSALAGRGKRNRLLDDCKAPEAGRMVSQNRLGQAPEPPDPYRDARVAGQHDDSKTQQLHRRSGQTDSRRRTLCQCPSRPNNAGRSAGWRQK